jgi:hypothetical protein
VIIVPGLGVGDCTLGMSKDDVLKSLGEPREIVYGGESYTLNNLPRRYYMTFGFDISFYFVDDSVNSIAVYSPLYKFANGLGVGDLEEKIKQAFGSNFHLKEGGELTYEDEGLTFEIHKKDRTVKVIEVSKKIEPIIIVPGQGVGDYTLGMSKDEVLSKLGEPKRISCGGESYTLNNLPKRYYMSFGDISFEIADDTVTGIDVHSPLYKFANGLGVGDSEDKIKQAFGNNFHLKEGAGKDVLTYQDEGLTFEIHKEDRTVIEIGVTKKISRGHEDSLVKPIKSVKEFDGVRSKDLSKLDLSFRKGLIATLVFNQETLRPRLYDGKGRLISRGNNCENRDNCWNFQQSGLPVY